MIFINNFCLQRIKTLPEIDGLSKDTVLTSWMAKYDAITKGNIWLFLMKLLELWLTSFSLHSATDDEPRRPGQRLPTSMLGNEVMSKEQLYDLFQQILNVKKFEHQLLYNAMQVRPWYCKPQLMWFLIFFFYFFANNNDLINREITTQTNMLKEIW